MAQLQTTEPSPLVAYCVAGFCAVMLVVGGLAAFFEQAAIVRILGALAAVLALVVGSFIARGAWPKRPTVEV